MGYFGATPDKNNQDQDVGETAKHPARVSGAFWRVKEKSGRAQNRRLASTPAHSSIALRAHIIHHRLA